MVPHERSLALEPVGKSQLHSELQLYLWQRLLEWVRQLIRCQRVAHEL